MTQTYTSVKMNQKDLHKDPMTNNSVSNVQPSQDLAPRVFPPLPYRKEYF